MIEIRRHALVRHTPAEMFALVNDVEAYPTRFPWCAGAAVLAREGDGSLVARLDLRIAGLTQSFTTRNTADAPHRLHMHLVEGPLKSLEGEWTFVPLGPSPGPSGHLLPRAGEENIEPPAAARGPTGCKIALALDFDYAGRLAGSALRLGFQGLANRMVDDFSRAAAKAYG